MEEVKRFITDVITNTLTFIKSVEESPAVIHNSHIVSNVYKIQLVLDVVQLIDDSVKPVQSKLVSLLTQLV